MLIRKAKLKDLHQVSKHAVSMLKYHHTLDPYFAPAKNVQEVYQKFFKKCIYSKNKLLLVAEENNKIVGYALGALGLRAPVFQIRKVGLINDVFVEKDFRKLGLAKQFLLELNKWFKSKKLKHVELTVHSENEIGKKAWAKSGFKGYMIKERTEI
jgi:GNAT superfamily N-acetyltransferase